MNQQTTDDLRVLKSTAFLDEQSGNLHHIDDYSDFTTVPSDGDTSRMATYEVELPTDYFHILNCICIYEIKKPFKCYKVGKTWRAAATRLTADAYSQIMDNYWNKPTYKRPYYYIHNINPKTYNNINPTNPYNSDNPGGTDLNAVKKVKT